MFTISTSNEGLERRRMTHLQRGSNEIMAARGATDGTPSGAQEKRSIRVSGL